MYSGEASARNRYVKHAMTGADAASSAGTMRPYAYRSDGMPDKVQREIEELLDKLDNFVPEERFASKIRDRRKREKAEARTGPTLGERIGRRFSGITLGHVMLAGIACFLIAFFARDQLGDAGRWISIAGLVLTLTAFVLSVVNKGSGSRTPLVRTGSGQVQKRWRGQVIEYGEPSTVDRVRGWFRRKGKR
jgi:hypothetical protein